MNIPDNGDMSVISPELQLVLEGLLIRTIEQFAAYQREYPAELSLASLHISPDSSYIAIEHETHSGDIVLRKSPACISVIVKV